MWKQKQKKNPGILSDLSEICTSDGYATAFFRSCSSSQMNGYATVWCNCQICKFQSAPTFVNFEMQNSHWNKTLFLKNQFTQIFTSLFYYFTVASHGDGKRLFVINLMNIQYSNGSHGSMIALFTRNFEPSCPKSKQYWIYKSIGYYLGGTPRPSWR